MRIGEKMGLLSFNDAVLVVSDEARRMPGCAATQNTLFSNIDKL